MRKPKYNGTYANLKGRIVQLTYTNHRYYNIYAKDSDNKMQYIQQVSANNALLFLTKHNLYCLDTMRSYDD